MSDEVRGPENAVKPLHSLAVSKIAKDLAGDLEPQLFKSFDEPSLKLDAFSFIQTAIDRLVARGVPTELLKALHAETSKYSNYLSFILAFFLGDKSENSLIAQGEGQEKILAIPPACLEFLMGKISYGLETIDVSALRVDDRFLQALVDSSAAPSLRTLIAEYNEFTDDVAPLWTKLPVLEELNLNNGKHLTERSLVEIAKLSTISVLRLNQLERCSLRDIAPIALDEHALPNLCHLEMFNDFEDVHTATRTQQEKRTTRVIDLLEKRPNRERLEYLYAKFVDDPEIAMKIHTLCPNLTAAVITDVPLNMILESRGSMSKLQEMDISFDERDLVTEDFALLSSVCPQLTSLTLSSVQMSPDCRLDMLTSVKKLTCYSMPHLLTMMHWPPNLDKLALVYIGLAPPPEGLTNEDLIDPFINNICTALPLLEEFAFVIDMSEASLKQKHVLQLLSSLRNLRIFRSPIDFGSIDDCTEESFITLNSPSLQLIRPTCFGEVPLACGRLPSFKSISIEHYPDRWNLLERALGSISPASTPTLSEVFYNFNGDKDTLVSAQHDDVMESLLRVRNSLKLLSFDAPISLQQAQHLCSLAKLSSLRLSYVTLSDELCAQILKSLQHMVSFQLSSCEGLHTLNWLRHTRLSILHLSGITIDEPVVLSGTNVPNLKEISLSSVSTESITITRLPRLGVITVSAAGICRSLHISNCNLLHHLTMEQLSLSEFEVYDVPKMTHLTATGCVLSRATTFRAELPGLAHAELESVSSEKAFLTKWADELEAEARDGLKHCAVSFDEEGESREEDFYDEFETNVDEEEIDE